MKIICFGDSNTWGYDPRGYFGGRYDAPWPELLGEMTGWSVINQGENGRKIPGSPVFFPEDADLLILMLGTNDLLQGNSPSTVAIRMEAFLSRQNREVLLIAPPPMKPGQWVSGPQLIDASRELEGRYAALARPGVEFLRAGEWDIPLCFDGVHFTEEGHRRFAEGVARYLKQSPGKFVNKL